MYLYLYFALLKNFSERTDYYPRQPLLTRAKDIYDQSFVSKKSSNLHHIMSKSSVESYTTLASNNQIISQQGYHKLASLTSLETVKQHDTEQEVCVVRVLITLFLYL